MSYSKDRLLEDLAAFVDLGAGAPILVESDDQYIIRFSREGHEMELVFTFANLVIERYRGEERQHVNFQALLASPSLGNLSRWADSQVLQLRKRVGVETLPIYGRLSDLEVICDLRTLNDKLAGRAGENHPRVSVTLINGPAGIGKTSLIKMLSYVRAQHYRLQQRPLILHVESRGRVLQNLSDLMAFSLQTLRLTVAYDQIPSLVRNGLITLAIDGFDELGDPNGYDLAWAQVNDLLVACRGQGSIILSGRETFISKERIEGALTAVNSALDVLRVYTVLPINRGDAQKWLMDRGWPQYIFEQEVVAALFEQDSYALRPFFLDELAKEIDIVARIEEGAVEDLLSLLIEATITREAKKFGRDLEVVTTETQRRDFIQLLMEEVARDLAENQSDALPADTVAWLAEIVALEIVSPNLIGILKNRAGVIAFLGEDDRRSYRRFLHDQFFDYFLSRVTIRAIVKGETPKYIRRNILGLELLESFSSVFRRLQQHAADQFFDLALQQLDALGDGDRARRNLAALILAASSVLEPSKMIVIRNVSLDDVYFTGAVSPIILRSVTMAQVYAHGSDLSGLIFEGDSFIGSLIADEGTILPQQCPIPYAIELPDRTLFRPLDKEQWLINHVVARWPGEFEIDVEKVLKEHELFRLLGRAARYKPFWIRDGDEKATRRILDDPNWYNLRRILLEHDLLLERYDVPAAGRSTAFYHIKNKKSLLMWSEPPAEVMPFMLALLNESLLLKNETDTRDQ